MTIKRNVKENHTTLGGTNERLAQVESNQAKLMESVARMEGLLEKIAFHVVMETETLDNLFPIDSNDSIHQFMNTDDGRFNKRKRELEKLIFSVWTPDITKRQFSDGLINVLFTRRYIATHRWPHQG